MGEYGHDFNEWGLRDDSEKNEWEEYYETRNKILAWENKNSDE